MKTYSLQLFRILLDRPAVGFSDIEKESFESLYAELLASTDVSLAVVEDSMIAFGKVVWPYWQAYERFEQVYGKEPETKFFLMSLDEVLRKKWQVYDHTIKDHLVIDHAVSFEEGFTAEEHFAIEQAVITAKGKVQQALVSMIEEEKRSEYNDYVEGAKKEMKQIQALLVTLALIGKKQLDLQEEIAGQIRFFEKGFAQIEIDPTVEAVQGKIDYYRGHVTQDT